MATKASGTTPNIGLSQWEPTDFVCREDFNADNMLIDMAIGDSCKIAYGSYIGTGTYGKNNKSSLTFDFEPKMVAIAHRNGSNGTVTSVERGMLCLRGSNKSNRFAGAYTQHLEWNGNTFVWYASEGYNTTMPPAEQLNAMGEEYFYVAIG